MREIRVAFRRGRSVCWLSAVGFQGCVRFVSDTASYKSILALGDDSAQKSDFIVYRSHVYKQSQFSRVPRFVMMIESRVFIQLACLFIWTLYPLPTYSPLPHARDISPWHVIICRLSLGAKRRGKNTIPLYKENRLYIYDDIVSACVLGQR